MNVRLAALCASLIAAAPALAEHFDWAGQTATLERAGPADGPAAYNFTVQDTDGRLRRRHVAESSEHPRIRTNDTAFDAVFALAVEEMAGNRVEAIADGQFDHGAPMPCHCFTTGVKWPYVWTRDTSYSVELGGGLFDPISARNSLAFKRSDVDRTLVATGHPDERVVAQDTGSGGSWPISSDRVVWIHAAAGLVPLLPEEAAGIWAADVLRTSLDTLAEERRHTYDPASGLYRGETSFLDWREQTYPDWTRNDTLAIASSYALSTNVLHYLALRDTAALAGRAHEIERERTLAADATALGQAILARFYTPANGLYASYLFHDLAPIESYDLLGLALLAESGLLDEAATRRVLSAYPTSDGGPPVIWPERQTQPIYHNRAVWPFVTAYALRAAEHAHDSAHANAYARSLVRLSTFALTNQENAEFLTLAVHYEDGPYTGPVINSPSQLWSVAASLDLAEHSVFGLRADRDGLVIAPSFPAGLTGTVPTGGSHWTLEALPLAGGSTRIVLQFPATVRADDWLDAATIRADGAPLPEGRIDARHPPTEIVVALRAHAVTATHLEPLHVANPRALTGAEHAQVYAPNAPSIDAIAEFGGRVRLAVGGLAVGHHWELWRDGVQRSTGTAAVARDQLPSQHGAACYHLRQRAATGPSSLPSIQRCVDATIGATELAATDPAVVTEGPATRTSNPDRLALWGAPTARLHFTVPVAVTGTQRFTVLYRNDGLINTGVTAGVKHVTVQCGPNTTEATLVLPQLGDALRRGRSTPVEFPARAGDTCRFTVADATNMSYLDHFRHYTASRGGAGPDNTADLLSLRVEPIEPPAPVRH